MADGIWIIQLMFGNAEGKMSAVSKILIPKDNVNSHLNSALSYKNREHNSSNLYILVAVPGQYLAGSTGNKFIATLLTPSS
jgi:hypothetical protein